MSHRIRLKSRPAFTLIELLVSVAIIAVLIGMLLPVLSHARRISQSAKCLSNMRQVAMATQMYCQDNDGYFPRTMETTGDAQPLTTNWWAIQNYQGALNKYILTDKGGVSEDGIAKAKGTVWFDPADPDANIPAMWGSFVDNGLITGVSRKDTRIATPSDTIYATIREQHWAEVTGETPPTPLPVSDVNHAFWSSVYFDMCLDPWAPTDDPQDAFHWTKDLATPPASLFPNAIDAGAWDQVIEGRHPAAREHRPRYGNKQPYSFCDGHASMMRFEDTYSGVDGNLWDVR